jgi:hypothetical protein
MAIKANPIIASTDMILCLDAANSRAYAGAGTSFTDLSSNRHTGTLVNGATYSSSNNGSFVFDGTNDYLNTVTATSLGINSASTPFTIGVWFKTTGTLEYYLFDNYNGDIYKNISLRIDNGKFEVYMAAASGMIDSVQFGSDYNDGNWHNFTLTWNGSNTINAYADGINIGSNTTAITGSFESNGAFQLGFRPVGGLYTFYFPGNIAQASVYKRALSAAEIRQNYNAIKGRFPVPIPVPLEPIVTNDIVTSGLVLLLDAANTTSYPGSGTIWTDLSGAGYTGTLTNGPTYNSANGGSIVFDNVDDYFSGSFSCNKTYYSVDFWCYPTQVSNYNWSIGFDSFWNDFEIHTTSGGGVYVGTAVNSRISPWRNNVFVVNTWQNFIWTFSNGAGKFYKNGVLEASANLSLSSRPSFTTYASKPGSCAGRISNFKVYSGKALSAEEVTQNFNAYRSQFGI